MLALRSCIVVACVCVVALTAGAQDPPAAPAAPPTPPAQDAPATTPDTPAKKPPLPPDAVWPQTAVKDGLTYSVDKPTFNTLTANQVQMSAPLQVTMSDGTVMSGHIDVNATVAPADHAGQVELNRMIVADAVLSGVDDTSTVKAALGALLAQSAMTVERDELVAGLDITPVTTPGLKHTPPAIRIVYKPTVLLSVDGSPRTAPLGNTGWYRVTNTPFILLKDPGSNWYLRLGQSDWRGAGGLPGPWQSVQAPDATVMAALGSPPSLPPELQQQQDDANKARNTAAAQTAPPDVMVMTVPTVLISLNGPPKMAPVADGIQGVSNTDSILLRTQTPDRWWTLASGRWFNAQNLNGPWGYVAPADLPASFSQLPSTGQYAGALASVPNTTAAKAAVVAGAEMRTVTIDRAKAQCSVKFTGAPRFTAITGTQLSYASNSNQPVIKVGDAYYCCDAAAWFTSAQPAGPWTLCDNVPEAIYDIPPSCPIYSCTYVEVTGSTADSVSFGFTPGYIGTYMQDGTAVYGTGYTYPPADLGEGNTQTYPQTYGSDPGYDPDSGTFAPPSSNEYIYEYPAVQPYYLSYGWPGWGWCNTWCVGWGWGWGGYGYWNHWGNYWNHWHPYYNNHWRNAWNDWHNNHLQGQNGRQTGPNAGNRDWNRATRNPGGERPTNNPGGERPTNNPGGERPTNNPGGERPTNNPGGERPTEYPGGERPTNNPGGERPTQYPGGERPTQYPGGQMPTRYPGGERDYNGGYGNYSARNGGYNNYTGFHQSYNQYSSPNRGYSAPRYGGGYRGGNYGGSRGGGGGGGRGGGGGGRR